MPQALPTITWGPWIKDPQYEDKENTLLQQFRAYTPFPDNHIFLKAGENERVKAYADSPSPYKEEANILTHAFLKPCTTTYLAGELTFL